MNIIDLVLMMIHLCGSIPSLLIDWPHQTKSVSISRTIYEIEPQTKSDEARVLRASTTILVRYDLYKGASTSTPSHRNDSIVLCAWFLYTFNFMFEWEIGRTMNRIRISHISNAIRFLAVESL